MKTSPRDFAAFVEDHLEIPTIPDVAARALREMGRPRTDGPRVAAVISRDQGLTSRVLQLTNSAALGLRRKVGSLEQAATILGFKRLKTLVITASCRQLYRHFGRLEMELWMHSMAAATATQLIAERRGLDDGGEAFIAGLMHDVGKVVMNNADPELFRTMMQEVEAQEVRDSEAAERAHYGFTHSEVGALLARHWALAPELEAVLLMHHEPDLLITVDDDARDLARAVILADDICHREGLGTPALEVEEPLHETEAAVELGFDERTLILLTSDIREAFENDRQLFN